MRFQNNYFQLVFYFLLDKKLYNYLTKYITIKLRPIFMPSQVYVLEGRKSPSVLRCFWCQNPLSDIILLVIRLSVKLIILSQ